MKSTMWWLTLPLVEGLLKGLELVVTHVRVLVRIHQRFMRAHFPLEVIAAMLKAAHQPSASIH